MLQQTSLLDCQWKGSKVKFSTVEDSHRTVWIHIKQDHSLKMCLKGNEGEQMCHFSVSSTQVGDMLGNNMILQTLKEIKCSD